MRWMLAGMLMVVMAAAAGRADELTDSLLGVDPRAGLGSGTGAVYGDVYGPEQPEDVSPLSEVEADDEANASFLGEYGLDELPSTLDTSTLDWPSEPPARPTR